MYQYGLRRIFAWMWVLAVVLTALTALASNLGLELSSEFWAGFNLPFEVGFFGNQSRFNHTDGVKKLGMVIGMVIYFILWAAAWIVGIIGTVWVFNKIAGDD
jgi:hypothetical protein